MAGKPFNSITDLLEDLLGSHIDKETLAKILSEVDQGLQLLKSGQGAQEGIFEALAGISKTQASQQTLLETIAADQLAIRAFLNVPDTEAVRSDQLAAIGDATTTLSKSEAELATAVEAAKQTG